MIYDNIKKICQKKDISITELEKATGISRGLIAKWKSCSPTIDKIKKVADYLGVPLEQLLEE